MNLTPLQLVLIAIVIMSLCFLFKKYGRSLKTMIIIIDVVKEFNNSKAHVIKNQTMRIV